MKKKILSVFLLIAMVFSFTACSSSDDSKGSSSTGTKIKDTGDFKPGKGMIQYFTIDGKNYSIPTTVGEYANYLSQLGDVTLNATGKKVEDETLKAKGLSSMVAYLNVELKDGSEQRFLCSYKNKTDSEISVAEATVTRLEFKYDVLSENEYEKTVDSMVFHFQNDITMSLNGKTYMNVVKDALGEPEQETDGRLTYSDDLGYQYTLDCCNEMAKGVFRGIIIKYPSK